MPPDEFLPAWELLTRLGEAQILLPMAAVAMLWLWLAAGLGRVAGRWLFWLCGAAAITTLNKLAFLGWCVGWKAANFTGLSGHAMFAAACLPMLAWVGLLDRSHRTRRLGVVLALALAVVIAYSRLKVNAHSPAEAWPGLALGLAACWLSMRGLPQAPGLKVPLWLPVAMLAAMLLLPASAPRSRTHDWVTSLALQLSGREHACQRTERWLQIEAEEAAPPQ